MPPAEHDAQADGSSVLPGAAALVEVRSEERSGRTVVLAAGQIDHDSAPVVEQALVRALEHCTAQELDLDLDLTGVWFCDCSALNTLLRTRRSAERNGTALHLVGISAALQRILDLTRTSELFRPTGPAPTGVR